MDHEISGFALPEFTGVKEAFVQSFVTPGDGAALSVFIDGKPVVDLWGGMADARSGAEWREDTISVIFSSTKGLVAILAARLVEDGLLDYEARVSDYWPEFAQAGKQDVRVKHLLSHRSGLSAPREDLTVADIVDWDAVRRVLERQEPLWTPGEGFAYHAITYGWLVGEVVRRVTSMSVGEYFRAVVGDPLGVDAWIGLQASELDRVAHLQVGSTLAALVKAQSGARIPGEIDWLDRAMTLGGALPRELVSEAGGFNDPLLQQAEIPGAGGIASARALATIWSATVTETYGVRLLRDTTLGTALLHQTDEAPVFSSPPPYPRWGMGFQLDSPARRYLGASSFGHDGAGGQVGFADRASRIGFGYVTDLMEADDNRATRIIDALRDVVGSEPR